MTQILVQYKDKPKYIVCCLIFYLQSDIFWFYLTIYRGQLNMSWRLQDHAIVMVKIIRITV